MWIIAMFLSMAWTLILMAPIHCRGPTFFDEETKYTYMDWEGIIFYQIVIFGVNYSFNAHS